MKGFVARHRAVLGLSGVAAFALSFALSSGWPATEAGFWVSRGALGVLALIGVVAIAGSPYWNILYREAPLKRAMTGFSDLDERELALRDRANGLTYYAFFLVNLLMLLSLGHASDAGWIAVDGGVLVEAAFPYALFAVTLPVIMLEWFEPSGPAGGSAAEEEG